MIHHKFQISFMSGTIGCESLKYDIQREITRHPPILVLFQDLAWVETQNGITKKNDFQINSVIRKGKKTLKQMCFSFFLLP